MVLKSAWGERFSAGDILAPLRRSTHSRGSSLKSPHGDGLNAGFTTDSSIYPHTHTHYLWRGLKKRLCVGLIAPGWWERGNERSLMHLLCELGLFEDVLRAFEMSQWDVWDFIVWHDDVLGAIPVQMVNYWIGGGFYINVSLRGTDCLQKN